jgi:hypothetical protein
MLLAAWRSLWREKKGDVASAGAAAAAGFAARLLKRVQGVATSASGFLGDSTEGSGSKTRGDGVSSHSNPTYSTASCRRGVRKDVAFSEATLLLILLFLLLPEVVEFTTSVASLKKLGAGG